MKISLVVCNRDELYLERHLLSVDRFVDEIVLVDASKHPIDEQHLKDRLQCDLTCIFTDPDIGKQLDKGIMQSRHPFVFRWDSDFMGLAGVETLFEFIRNHTGLFAVATPVINTNLIGKTQIHQEFYDIQQGNESKCGQTFISNENFRSTP